MQNLARRLAVYVVALAGMAAALALREALTPWLGAHTFPYITAYGAVALAVWIGGTGPALLAALAGFAGASVFFGPVSDPAAPLIARYAAAFAAYTVSAGLIIFFGAALRRSRQRLAAAVSTDARLAAVTRDAHDAIIVFGADDRIEAWNPAAERLFGYRADEAIGQPGEIMTPPEGRAERAALLARVRGGQTVRAETVRVAKSGEPIDVLFSMAPLLGPDGRPDGCVAAIVQDIGERRRAQRELQRSEAQLRQTSEQMRLLTDALPALVSYIDADLRYRFVNRPYADWFDRSADEIVGRTAREILGESAWLHVEPQLRCALTGEAVQFQAQIDYARAGLRWVHASFTPQWDEAHQRVLGVVVLVYDIAAAKQAEAALLEADRQKDAFLATLAHELRNPLAPIRTGVQLLRRQALPAPAERPLSIIERQLAHLVRLIDDLLDLSRIGSDKLELRRQPIDLARAVRDAVETSRPLIDAAGHHLDVTLAAHAVMIDADLTRIAQVLANLLNNAAKFTPRDGHIALVVEPRGDTVQVRIDDDGEGIDAEQLPHIFDMFTQVDRSLERRHGGLGIGLAIARRLTELHGGRLEAASAGRGQGSRFVVTLPVLASVPDAAAVAEAAEAGAPDGADVAPAAPAAPAAIARRVLIADDNVDSGDSLAELLGLLGDEIRVARDGVEALEVAAQFRPQIALLDIGMPRLNGFDLARRLREQPWGREMTLIALTGWGQGADRRRSRDAGFDHHLVKPVDPATLERLMLEHRT